MQEIVVYDSYDNILTNLVQYDKDVYIHIIDSGITSTYPVQFFNSISDVALVMESTYNNGILSVKIPNDLLEQPYAITGYVNIKKNDESKCLYGFRIAVRKKPKPSNWVHVDSEDYVTFEQIVAECRDFAKNALASETNAKTSEENAKTYANNAKTSEENAKISEENAKTSAKASSVSEQNAKISETNVKVLELNAQIYAGNAKISETNAKSSETNAKQSEDNAKKSLEIIQQAESVINDAEQHVEEIQQDVNTLVDDSLFQSTKDIMIEVKKYLDEINSAKEGFILNIAAGNAGSYDVNNIDGGNATTVDTIKYDTGNALSVLN